MSNVIALIAEIRKLATLGIIVYVFYSVLVPALDTLLLVEEVTNDVINITIDTATATAETVTDYTCGYLWSCE